jgi:hypothetical protein
VAEQLRYEVIAKLSHAEIRRYPSHIRVTTFDLGDMVTSGNRSFRRLASYIFGSNASRESIAMTAPVLQQVNGEGFRTSFVMPMAMSMSTMPSTSDASLKMELAEGGLFGAISFSGQASQRLFGNKAQTLSNLIVGSGYQISGDPIYARYNGPWTPGFLRRNEVLIPIKG